MKKLAMFLMILSVSVFSIGCGGKTKTDKTESAPAEGTEGGHEPAAGTGTEGGTEGGTGTEGKGTEGKGTEGGTGTEMP